MKKSANKKSKGKKSAFSKLKKELDSNYSESVADTESCFDCVSVTSFTSLPNNMGDWDDCNFNFSTEGLSLNDLETKLIDYLDKTNEKNAKTRVDALKKLRSVLSSTYMCDFICSRRDTIAESIKRCLRKGKVEEQENAAILASLLFITLGSSSDCDIVFEDLYSILNTYLNDKSIGSKCREQCALALAVGCFISPIGIDYVKPIMESLFGIFSLSFPNREGVYPNLSVEITSLHNAALNAWNLLITLLNTSKVISLSELYLDKIAFLLNNSDQDLRLSAGETIALLHEISRESNPEFEVKNVNELSDKLKELATYSQKFRSKKYRKIERSNFRDIIRTVLDFESPNYSIRRKDEFIELSCWSKKIQYDVFCQILESGMLYHLGENQLLRDILDLGAIPLEIDTHELRKYKKMESMAADKARSKVMRELQGKKYEIF